MKLYIKDIEEQDGTIYNDYWEWKMYLVNGKYLASSKDENNIGKKKFDLKIGEEAEVEIEDGLKTANQWIIRKSIKTNDEGSTPIWQESKKTPNTFWRRDKFDTVYILTLKFTTGYSGNRAFDLRVIYADKTEKYFSVQELTKLVGSKIRGNPYSLLPHDESTSERNGNRLTGNYSRARVQGDVKGWVDEMIAAKEAKI